MSIVSGMVEQRRIAAHARCRVKSWRLTELQAWELADEIRWLRLDFKEITQSLEQIVQSMKDGKITILGAKVTLR